MSSRPRNTAHDQATAQPTKRERHASRSAVLHLGIALELLAKARLAADDLGLLVRKGIAMTDAEFLRGEFQSIGLEEAFSALDRQARFSLSPHQQKVLRSLRALRNRVVHFVDFDQQAEAPAIFVAAANLFVELTHRHLADWDTAYGMQALPETVSDLTTIKGFVSERLSSLADRLRKSKRVRTHHFDECSGCLQDAAIMDGLDIVCLFCGLRATIEERAKGLSEDGSVGRCPECAQIAVARHEVKLGSTYECCCCGHYDGPEIQWSDGRGGTIHRLWDEADRSPIVMTPSGK